MEPIAKVLVGGVVENHHAQDDGCLQHQQRIVSFSIKVVEQLCLGKERLLRGRGLANPQADSTSAGAWRLAGVNMAWSMNSEQSPD